MNKNLILFVMLIILANLSLSKTLSKKSSQLPPDAKRFYKIYIGWQYLKASEDFEDELIATTDSTTSKYTKWLFIKNSDNTYSITVQASKLALTTRGGRFALLPLTGDDTQKFIYENKTLKSKATGNCLKMYPGNGWVEQAACSDKQCSVRHFAAFN